MEKHATEERSIAPRPRPGEEIPQGPEGKVPTRLYGEVVFVSQKQEGEAYYGNSPYTERQLGELDALRTAQLKDVRQALQEEVSKGAW